MKQKPDYVLIREWYVDNRNTMLPGTEDGWKKIVIGGKLWNDLLKMLRENEYNNSVNDTEYTGGELLEILYDNNVETGYEDI